MTFMNRYAPVLVTGLLVALLLAVMLELTTLWDVRAMTMFTDIGVRIREVWGPVLPELMFVFYWGVIAASGLYGLKMMLASARTGLTAEGRWWMALRGMVLVMAPIAGLFLSILARTDWALWMPGAYDWLVFTSVAVAVVVLLAGQDVSLYVTRGGEPMAYPWENTD